MSKVSFKKARPNPLIFDLALEKSPKLQQWFSYAGDKHGIKWQVTSNKTVCLFCYFSIIHQFVLYALTTYTIYTIFLSLCFTQKRML